MHINCLLFEPSSSKALQFLRYVFSRVFLSKSALILSLLEKSFVYLARVLSSICFSTSPSSSPCSLQCLNFKLLQKPVQNSIHLFCAFLLAPSEYGDKASSVLLGIPIRKQAAIKLNIKLRKCGNYTIFTQFLFKNQQVLRLYSIMANCRCYEIWPKYHMAKDLCFDLDGYIGSPNLEKLW